MADVIRYEVESDGVAWITIDRPEKRGAMTYAILADFIATVARAGEDETARVVVVTARRFVRVLPLPGLVGR